MKVNTLILAVMSSVALVACGNSAEEENIIRLSRCAGATFMLQDENQNSLTAEWHQQLMTEIKKTHPNFTDRDANRLSIRSIDTRITEFKKHQYTSHNLEQFYIKNCSK